MDGEPEGRLVRTRLLRSPKSAAEVLVRGGLVAFPTETVYGLGASAFDRRAVARIFRAKGRPADNPLIIHVAERSQIPLLASAIPPVAERLMAAFFPGPLTVILPRHPAVPDEVTAGLDSVGVRMPSHPGARDFLTACGVPVAAPSANRSGRPSPTDWRDVVADLDGRIDAVLQGSASDVGLESTVVDCRGARPVILRPGAVTLEELRRVVPSVRLHKPGGRGPVRSPGLRHRHYAPRAGVVLVETLCDAKRSASAGFIGLRPPLLATGFGRVCLCRDPRQYAQLLFRFFRECDAAGLRTIYCETVPEQGIGRALMDRLRRAAER